MKTGKRFIPDELYLIAEYGGKVLTCPWREFMVIPEDYYWSEEECQASLYSRFETLDKCVRDYFASHGLNFPVGEVKITGYIVVHGLSADEEMSLGERYDSGELRQHCRDAAESWIDVYRERSISVRHVSIQEYCEEYDMQLHVVLALLGCLTGGLGFYDCGELLASDRLFSVLSLTAEGLRSCSGGLMSQHARKGLYEALGRISEELSAMKCCQSDKNDDICSET